jgi:hypothetical protein
MFPQSFGSVNPFQAYTGINPFFGGVSPIGVNPFLTPQTGFPGAVNPGIAQLGLVNPAIAQLGFVNPAIAQLGVVNPTLLPALLAQASLASPYSGIGSHSIGQVGGINPLFNPPFNPIMASGLNPGMGGYSQFGQQTPLIPGLSVGQVNPLALLAQQQLPIRSLVPQPFEQQTQSGQFSGINPLTPIIQAHLASQMINPWQQQGLNPWQHHGLSPFQQGYAGGFHNPLQALAGYPGAFGQGLSPFGV